MITRTASWASAASSNAFAMGGQSVAQRWYSGLRQL